jgi:hypothetical protein
MLDLGAEAEQTKQRAIMQHKTQLAVPDLSVFMRSFIRTNEVFAAWEPARIGRLDRDTPGPDVVTDSATILREPVESPVLPPRRGPWDVADVAVARGGDRVWVGIRPTTRIDPAMRYGAHVRLFGGGRAQERIDISVTGENAEALRRASNAAELGAEPEVLVAGSHLWVSIPAAPFAGRTRIMVQTDAAARPGSKGRSRSLWRTLDL